MVSVKTKSEAVAEITRLIAAVSDKFDGYRDEADAEREYLATRMPARLTATLGDVPTLAIHLLAAIAESVRIGDEMNIVQLATHAGQLKGTVSKHVQRLVEAGLVTREPVPGNRKELRLGLTADGRRVADAHARMHDEMDGGFRDFLVRYTVAELAVLTKVLDDLARSERAGVRLVPPVSAAGRASGTD